MYALVCTHVKILSNKINLNQTYCQLNAFDLEFVLFNSNSFQSIFAETIFNLLM